jgi:hypothetical protein
MSCVSDDDVVPAASVGHVVPSVIRQRVHIPPGPKVGEGGPVAKEATVAEAVVVIEVAEVIAAVVAEQMRLKWALFARGAQDRALGGMRRLDRRLRICSLSSC